MAETTELLDVIRNLIQTCRDGEDGYLHAASHVTDTGTQEYFKEMSLERKGFVLELREIAVRLGEREPDTSGSVAGTLHRTWFAAKADMGLGDQAVINSVESGEDAAKKAYETALAAGFTDDVRQVIQKQADRVLAAHDHVRDLRDRKAA
jgi:uncharacterized protein (TIGR02284 family)